MYIDITVWVHADTGTNGCTAAYETMRVKNII